MLPLLLIGRCSSFSAADAPPPHPLLVAASTRAADESWDGVEIGDTLVRLLLLLLLLVLLLLVLLLMLLLLLLTLPGRCVGTAAAVSPSLAARPRSGTDYIRESLQNSCC